MGDITFLKRFARIFNARNDSENLVNRTIFLRQQTETMSAPRTRDSSVSKTVVNTAVVGAAAYGVYQYTKDKTKEELLEIAEQTATTAGSYARKGADAVMR